MKLIKDLGFLYPSENSKKRVRFGMYECPACKSPTKIATTRVTTGRAKSCLSCSKKKFLSNSTTHCMSGTRLYITHKNMIGRCYKPKDSNYRLYGERGIRVCAEWHDRETFFKWALSNGYTDCLTIDRINADGNYTPENCRWADLKAQAQNRRKRKYCSSQFIGIRKLKCGVFESRVMIDGKRHHIGRFKSEHEAALERDKFIIASGNIYSKLNILTR